MTKKKITLFLLWSRWF